MPHEPVYTDQAEPYLVALHAAGYRLGFDTSGTELLRLHGSGIFHLPREGLVGRVLTATDENRRRLTTALAVTAWLVEQDFPAIRPASSDLTEVDGYLVSFWQFLPQPARSGRPPAAVLGTLLRRLHALPQPPFPLPNVAPLARLESAMATDRAREEPVLTGAQRAYLEEHMARLASAYRPLEFPLGLGLIHNDAHLGNLLVDDRSHTGYVLADWDGTCRGPREIDLVQEGAPGNRFSATEEQRQAFSAAYGYDLAGWPGWRTLRALRDLHSLSGHIRTAPAKPAAREELELRLASLMTGDRSTRWHAVA
jgi:Ser/Thr protein kinase RdoA (MazF antagonist)